MQSKARTVEQYLKELPPDRRQAIEAVRAVIKKSLDRDVEEGMSYGMIGYYIPHRVYPAGYHCDPKQPLPYAALASQKNHMAIYLCTLYGAQATGERELLEWFQKAWAKTGKKLDMGKSCIRFKKLEDLNLDLIGEAIRRMPSGAYIASYERILHKSLRSRAPAANKKSNQPASAKKASKKPVKASATKANVPRSATKNAAKRTRTQRSQ